MGLVCWSQRIIFRDRNLFISIPFFSAGVGADELFRGIQGGDTIRITAAVALLLQGLFASFIFIRNGIDGRGWRCRNLVLFMVGGISGLMIGLLIYYPVALDIHQSNKQHHSWTNTTLSDTNSTDEDSNSSTVLPISTTIDPKELTNDENVASSKLWFLLPDLALTFLVLVNTVYGISIKLKVEKVTNASNPNEEELEPATQSRSHMTMTEEDD